jgi:hypothetical protein
MSGTCDRAKRYRDRAEERLQIVNGTQTPATGQPYLEIAEHYLRLAVLEMTKRSHQASDCRPTESLDALYARQAAANPSPQASSAVV